MIRYLIIFIRKRTRAYAIHYLKIRDAMKNNKKEQGTPVDGSLPLEVKDLFKKYGKKSDYAVKDISFSCAEGEVVGILGANGAGKSTTLKCITGMIPCRVTTCRKIPWMQNAIFLSSPTIIRCSQK